MNKLHLFIFICSILILNSCTYSQILCGNAKADIYIDGAFAGKGTAKVVRVGPPNTCHLEAKLNGHVIGKAEMSREMTATTLYYGISSWGLGLLFLWEYPESYIIPIEMTAPDNNYDPWAPKNSKWKKK